MGDRLYADFGGFQAKLDWISGLLKSRDVRERLDPLLLGRIQDSVAGIGSEEIAKLGSVTASGAGNFSIKVEDGGLFEDVVLALGALGFKFHEDSLLL